MRELLEDAASYVAPFRELGLILDTASAQARQSDASGLAVFSADRRYRYCLIRQWDAANSVAVWVMLNPSTAGALSDDKTVQRCVYFSKSAGYGAIIVVNLYALISTSPKGLFEVKDPQGKYNHVFLQQALELGADWAFGCSVVAAWGAVPGGLSKSQMADFMSRRRVVHDLVFSHAPVYCLGTTADSSPRHPSRLGNAAALELYAGARTWSRM